MAPLAAINVSPGQLRQIQVLVDANPDDLAGLGFDPAHSLATVFIVSGRESLSSTVASLSLINAAAAQSAPDGTKHWTLQFGTAKYSLRTLEKIRDEIDRIDPFAGVARPNLAEWYVDSNTNTVVVGVTAITAAISTAAQKTFGAMVRLITASKSGLADRTNDFSPWDGGDVITSGAHGCTSGFGAYDTTGLAHGELGAGHCFDSAGVSVYQGGHLMGQVDYWAKGGARTIDFAFTGSTYTGSDSLAVVWATTNTRAVESAYTGSSLFSYQVCTSGSRTLENCAGQVIQQDLCLSLAEGYTACHLYVGNSLDGSQMVIAGDSGGPVYHMDYGTGNVQAVGIIIGCYGQPCNTGAGAFISLPLAFVPSRYQVMTTAGYPPAPSSRPALMPNQWLYPNQSLHSSDWNYELIMQGDGNLVTYSTTGVIWASGTHSNNASAVMQSDGNLVIYSSSGPIWSTNTQGNSGAYLYLDTAGTTRIYNWNGSSVLWRAP